MESIDIHLRGVGTVLPGPPLDVASLAKRFGMTETWRQWVDTFIGTRTRHLALDLDTGEVTQSLADLAEGAAARALATAGLGSADVDLIVMGTSTPDQLMPATVNLVADRLGIDRIPTYQMQSGCSGAIQALDVARQLLLAGRHRTALVIGGDTVAKHADLGINLQRLDPAQLVNVVMFGDGAGAAVLSTTPGPGSVLLRQAFVELNGLGREPGHVVEWFGLRDRHLDLSAGAEDYKAIEARVPELAAEILATLLEDLDWIPSDLDYLLPPQLSGRMTTKIVEHLAVPDAREVSCVTETANTGNALPFFQLELLLPQMQSGERALGIAVESSKWIKAGYALEKL
jgi:3-oxoacyl-[acyl-carrier-protein] synthase-3